MNLIQRQADDFLKYNLDERGGEYKEFIQAVRTELWEYKKASYKIEFIKHLIGQVKIEFDNHDAKCSAKIKSECGTNKHFENVLFFLQEELEDVDSSLNANDFVLSERESISNTLKKIVDDLNLIKMGQQITYEDFQKEFEELKDYYFLNKKNWTQLLARKLTEMVAGGVISETISKKLLSIIHAHYSELVT